MKECLDCEYRGYNPEICLMHAKSCKYLPVAECKPLPRTVKVGASVLAWAGLGVAAVYLGVGAVSLVGGAAFLHAGLIKLTAGAGLAGGGIGLCKGLLTDGEGKDFDLPGAGARRPGRIQRT